MTNSQGNADSEKPVLLLIQQIKDGLIKPATLTKEQRQSCVEFLVVVGYSISQIAQIVDRSEKTIKRDLADIRARNALNPSPELAKQIVGDLFLRTEAHHARLMRIAGGTEGSPNEKAQATFLAFRVLKERTELLQSLGYLPQKPQQIVGDVFHHLESDSSNSLETTRQTILEIETVTKDLGNLTPELAAEIKSLQQQLEQAQLYQDAQRLLEKQKQKANAEETSHES